MIRVTNRHLRVEGRDEWFLNPVTWVSVVCAAGFLLTGWHLAALTAALLVIAANLEIEYRSETENLNTNPNQ